MTRIILILLVTVLPFISAGNALAHKVNIFAYVEDGTVYTESYFPDGRKVQHGTVEVYDASGTKLLSGTTDTAGEFSFPLPKKEDLTIVINASMGHKNSFVLKKEEIKEEME